VLFGRDDELRKLAARAKSVLEGTGAAVFLDGRPGMGKTALLDALAQTYAESFPVLRAAGHSDESALPFAAVERLTAPIDDIVESLPVPQRLALQIIFGLEEGSAEPLLVHLAVTSALQALADQAPLLVLVDDFHFLDQYSAQAISFMSRRIGEVPVFLVCAGANGGGGHTMSIEGERLVLGPLGEADSVDLLEQWAPSSSTAVRRNLVEAVGGVPFQLRQALDGLTPDQLAGQAPLPEPPPDPGAARVADRPDPIGPGAPAGRGRHPGIMGSDGFEPGDVLPRPAAETAEAELAFARGDVSRLTALLHDSAKVGESGVDGRRARLAAVHTLVARSSADAVEELLAAARRPYANDRMFVLDTLNMAVAAAWLTGDPCALLKARGALAELRPASGVQATDSELAGPVALRVLAGPRNAVGPAAAGETEGATQESASSHLAADSGGRIPGFPVIPGLRPMGGPEQQLPFYVNLLREAVDGDEWGSIPVAAYWTACLEAWSGRWNEAAEHARLGLSSAVRTRQVVLAGHLRGLLAWLHAALGDVAACVAEAEACLAEPASHVSDSVRLAAEGALVFAALSEGRPEEVPGLLTISPVVLGESVLGGRGALGLSDVIEAAYRTFDTDRAEELMDAWRERMPLAHMSGTEVLMLRCEALLEHDTDEMERKFRVVFAAAHPNLFEFGRAKLLFGERLRRARRLRSAREELLAAVGVFRSVGARMWVERAQRELDACVTHSATAQEGWQALTAQERQVLRLAGRGLTNRQIAQVLFISPRTVGYHLYKAFPKLHIRSRQQIRE
jgi:DNA-binding CsgD family transcriptional regulator